MYGGLAPGDSDGERTAHLARHARLRRVQVIITVIGLAFGAVVPIVMLIPNIVEIVHLGSTLSVGTNALQATLYLVGAGVLLFGTAVVMLVHHVCHRRVGAGGSTQTRGGGDGGYSQVAVDDVRDHHLQPARFRAQLYAPHVLSVTVALLYILFAVVLYSAVPGTLALEVRGAFAAVILASFYMLLHLVGAIALFTNDMAHVGAHVKRVEHVDAGVESLHGGRARVNALALLHKAFPTLAPTVSNPVHQALARFDWGAVRSQADVYAQLFNAQQPRARAVGIAMFFVSLLNLFIYVATFTELVYICAHGVTNIGYEIAGYALLAYGVLRLFVSIAMVTHDLRSAVHADPGVDDKIDPIQAFVYHPNQRTQLLRGVFAEFAQPFVFGGLFLVLAPVSVTSPTWAVVGAGLVVGLCVHLIMSWQSWLDNLRSVFGGALAMGRMLNALRATAPQWGASM